MRPQGAVRSDAVGKGGRGWWGREGGVRGGKEKGGVVGEAEWAVRY